ncbi:MAG: clostripain-related cysteine peptidase [Candidatus Xenobia bacterium]
MVSAVRDWSFIVLKVDGHGLSADIQSTMDGLDQDGTSGDAYITVRAEQNGELTDYALRERSQPGHHLAPLAGGLSHEPTSRTPALSQAAMTSFLKNAMQQAPAKHTCVIFEGHSRMLRQVIPQMHEALRALGCKVDVLCFDSCFMGQVETAAQYKDVAQTLVASEDSVDGSRQIQTLAQDVAAHPMTAQDVAKEMVHLSAGNERTFSALDLTRMQPLEDALKAFAGSISQIQDGKTLAKIRDAVHESQHFYTQGHYHASTYHATVDVVDAIQRIIAIPGIPPALVAQGQRCIQAIPLLAEQHASDRTRDWTFDYSQDQGAHGLSVHFPTTPSPWRSQYTYFHNSTFNQETGWDGMIAHLTSSKNPAYRMGSALQDAGGLGLWGVQLGLEDLQEHWQAWRQAHDQK